MNMATGHLYDSSGRDSVGGRGPPLLGGIVAATKKNRTISTDSLALRYAMTCAIAPLRQAAIAYVKDVIASESGATTRISTSLGVSTSTYLGWVADVPEVQTCHYAHRPENAPGRVPKALQQGTPRRRRKTKA